MKESQSDARTKSAIEWDDEQSLKSVLASVLNSVPDGMIVIDEQGTILAFSAAAERMFGYAAAEVEGRNVSELMTSKDRTHHDQYIRNYVETGVAQIVGIGRIVEGRTASGETLPVELKIGEAEVDGRRVFTGFVRDVTDRQAQQHRLTRLQAELSNFSRLSAAGSMASAMAHELNQPLTAVANYIEAARDMLTEPDELTLETVREALDAAAKQSIRAGQIVRRLRAYVSRGEIEMRNVALEPVLEDAASLSRIGVDGPLARMVVKCAEDLPQVRADKLQLKQVIVNLARNAHEALADTSTPLIEVSARVSPENSALVEIAVSDNGPGLELEEDESPFDAFNSTKATGMGLGLAICRTIVEAHGGHIEVHSTPSEGACFSFTLPRADKDDAE